MRCVEFNGTNLEFVVEFFETLTTLNNTSANKSNPIIGYHVGSALFLGTLKGVKDLVRYSNAQPAPTGNDAVDIITMKDYYLHAAGLCDGNDESDKMSNPKSRINALVHEFGIKAEDTATATALIRAFAANRAYRGPDPATRISDAIFHSLPREDQKKWATMAPQSKKLLFDDIKGDRERPSGRPSERKQRVMFTNSKDVSDDDVFEDVAQYEVFDDDSPNSLLAKVHDLLVNVTKGKNQNVKKSKPLKSDLHAAHPARLLSDAKEVVYKKNGNTFVPVGTMNARMHRWMTVEEVSETNTTTIRGVTCNVSASKLMQLLCQALIDRGQTDVYSEVTVRSLESLPTKGLSPSLVLTTTEWRTSQFETSDPFACPLVDQLFASGMKWPIQDRTNRLFPLRSWKHTIIELKIVPYWSVAVNELLPSMDMFSIC